MQFQFTSHLTVASYVYRFTFLRCSFLFFCSKADMCGIKHVELRRPIYFTKFLGWCTFLLGPVPLSLPAVGASAIEPTDCPLRGRRGDGVACGDARRHRFSTLQKHVLCKTNLSFVLGSTAPKEASRWESPLG